MQNADFAVKIADIGQNGKHESASTHEIPPLSTEVLSGGFRDSNFEFFDTGRKAFSLAIKTIFHLNHVNFKRRTEP